MKKGMAFALILMLSLSLLAGCSGGGGSNNVSENTAATITDDSYNNNDNDSGNETSPEDSSSAPNTPIRREVEVPDKPLDLSDESIWFVVIDGVRFNLMEITVKDFLDAGFYLEQDEDNADYYFDENTLVEPNSNIGTMLSGTSLYKQGTDGNIYFIPVNRTDHSIPVKDCEIQSVLFNTLSSSALDIYTVCNLSTGSTEEEVFSVFGDDHEDPGDFSLTFAENSGGYLNRYFCFVKNADGIIYEIEIFTNKRVINDWE